MEINTNYNIYDFVFMMASNVIYEVQIKSISIRIGKSELYISYTIENNPAGSQYTLNFDESELFETKENLAKYLIETSK